MANNYLNYYQKIQIDGKIAEGFPITPDYQDPQALTFYEGYN